MKKTLCQKYSTRSYILLSDTNDNYYYTDTRKNKIDFQGRVGTNAGTSIYKTVTVNALQRFRGKERGAVEHSSRYT